MVGTGITEPAAVSEDLNEMSELAVNKGLYPGVAGAKALGWKHGWHMREQRYQQEYGYSRVNKRVLEQETRDVTRGQAL